MYSEMVKKYFENPINLGIIEDADAVGVIKNESCSDIIKIYIKVDKQDIITDAKFEVKGCPPVIASCCVVTEMIKNMNIENANSITADEIIEKLNGLPKEKEHCAELVEKTLKQVIINFIGNGKIELDNINTWGEKLKKLLLKLSKLEEDFEEKSKNKSIFERLSRDNVDKIKKYNQEKKKIEKQIIEAINSRKIICYHCTRLTNEEFESIRENGLMVLSKAKQIDRIENLKLDIEERNKLIMKIDDKDLSNREGQIHFIYSLITIDTGCIPFLKYWGGESLYNNVNEIKLVKNKILDISKPYVVKFTIKYSDICAGFLIENMKKKLNYGNMSR